MAAFKLPNSVFLHIPKTGGGTVVNCLKHTSIPITPIGVHPHLKVVRPRYKDVFTIAFVRNPITWWESRWLWQKDRARVQLPLYGTKEWSDHSSYPEFVENILLEGRPLHRQCSKFFRNFIGPVDDPIDFIGKCENLCQDIEMALDAAKEDLLDSDRVAIKRDCKSRVHDQIKRRRRWDTTLPHSLLQQLADTEKDIMDTFNYSIP